MADYGIKITKSGEDISSTDEKDYVFWSKYYVMKTIIWATVGYTFSADIDSVSIEIDHNLGDAKLAWWSHDGSAQDSEWVGYDWWWDYYENGGDKAIRTWYYDTEANTFWIQYRELNQEGSGYDTTGKVWDFKYYLFTESVEI